MITYLPARFRIHRDLERCIGCQTCVSQCSFGAHTYDELDDEVRSHDELCVNCHRCVVFCPTQALTITRNPLEYRENYNWRPEVIEDITRQAESGGILLTGMGDDKAHRIYWDHLVLNASQVTNPSIDPLREPMELRTYLGRKPDQVEIDPASLSLRTPLGPQVAIEMPLLFSAMSYGAVNLNVHQALARAAAEAGTLFNTGEGGLHRSLYRLRRQHHRPGGLGPLRRRTRSTWTSRGPSRSRSARGPSRASAATCPARR